MAAQLSQSLPTFDQTAAKICGLIFQLPQKLSVAHTTVLALKLAAQKSQDTSGGVEIYWPDAMEALGDIVPQAAQYEALLESILSDVLTLREAAAATADNAEKTTAGRKGMSALARAS